MHANISTFKDRVDPTYLGVSYYLAALNVPAMVVVHVVIFAYLLRGGVSKSRPDEMPNKKVGVLVRSLNASDVKGCRDEPGRPSNRSPTLETA